LLITEFEAILRRNFCIVLLILGFLYLSRAPVTAQSTTGGTPAAQVGEEIISLEEIQKALKPQLAEVERARYKLIDEKLEELIAEKLLAAEAKRRGLTVDALLKQEVSAKAPKVTDQEVASFIEQNRNRLVKGDDAELKLKVWEYLRDLKINQQRGEYVRELRAKAGVKVYLEDPTAVKVDPNKGFSRGPQDAPIAIVEFSDFQCPFCQAAVATVQQLMAQNPGKVRWVFRDFPIPSLHPLAPKAHEAARCAAEQEKFWEYHDLLFERAPRLSPPDLKQYARDAKLNGQDFDQCFDSGKHQSTVAADVEEGTRLGVGDLGTPTFFINGRLIVGAQPIATFQKVVDGELAKKLSR
jgi:protein-disulfide isomerase